MAPQLTATNGPLAPRGWRAWIARATSSLPVPLSPVISTLLGVSAQRADVLPYRHDRRTLADQRMAGGRGGGRKLTRARGLGWPVAAERALHAHGQIIELERFSQIVGGTQPQRLDGRLHARVAGHENDAEIRLQRARAFEHVEAVEARHLDVAHHHVELVLGDPAQRVLAAAHRVDVVSLRAQQPADGVLNDRFVVDDQNGCIHVSSWRPAPRCFCISRSKYEAKRDTTSEGTHRQRAYRHTATRFSHA